MSHLPSNTPDKVLQPTNIFRLARSTIQEQRVRDISGNEVANTVMSHPAAEGEQGGMAATLNTDLARPFDQWPASNDHFS